MIAGLLGAFGLVGIETLPRCNLYSCEQVAYSRMAAIEKRTDNPHVCRRKALV